MLNKGGLWDRFDSTEIQWNTVPHLFVICQKTRLNKKTPQKNLYHQKTLLCVWLLLITCMTKTKSNISIHTKWISKWSWLETNTIHGFIFVAVYIFLELFICMKLKSLQNFTNIWARLFKTNEVVNVSLNFQTIISEIFQCFLLKKCEKRLQSKPSLLFSTENISVIGQ